MKTIEDKATTWLGDHFYGGWDDKDLSMLVLLLKEQDRDTRHACAEACLNVNTAESLHIISKMYHDVCMNTSGYVAKTKEEDDILSPKQKQMLESDAPKIYGGARE